MPKRFLLLAHCWLLVTLLIGALALAGCLVVPEDGHHDHDHDFHDDHGPAPYGDGIHRDPDQH